MIEKAHESDIDFVKQLETESGLSVWARKDYLAEVSRPDSIFLIIREEGEKLGFLLARLIMTKTVNQSDFVSVLNRFKVAQLNEIEIYNIAVRKAYRGKSIGTALLDNLTQIGEAENVCKINLEVRTSNVSALKFYRKNLFEVVGIRRNFYSNPTEDAILMTRSPA